MIFGNDIRIERIVSQLLHRLNEQARFETLKQAISNGSALSIIVRQVVALGQEQGKYGADEFNLIETRLLNEQHLEELEVIALKRIRDAAQQNSLLQASKLPEILFYWQSWAKEEVEQWIEQIVETDEGLVNFLEKFLQKDLSESSSDGMPKITDKLDSNCLESHLKLSSLIARLRNLHENSELAQARKTMISQLLQTYDLRQQSKEPNE